MIPQIGALQVAGALLAYARLAAISIGLSAPIVACGDGGWRQVSLETIPVRKLRANMTSSPAGARVAIKENNHHLPIAITSNSMMMNRPWWISFEGLEKQTFGYQNCAHSLGLSSYFGVPLPTEKGKGDDGDGK
jgi:hypothetical protein